MIRYKKVGGLVKERQELCMVWAHKMKMELADKLSCTFGGVGMIKRKVHHVGEKRTYTSLIKRISDCLGQKRKHLDLVKKRVKEQNATLGTNERLRRKRTT